MMVVWGGARSVSAAVGSGVAKVLRAGQPQGALCVQRHALGAAACLHNPLGPPIPKKPQPSDPLHAWISSMPAAYRVGMMELDPTVFGQPIRTDILQRVVVYQRAKWRAGTAKTKTRSEVRGGGIKPWPQKGTGRARASSIRSPLFRGGGTVHGPVPRDWSIKLPKNILRLGLRVALSAKLAQNDLVLVDSVNLPSGSQQDLLDALQSHGISGKALIVSGGELPSTLEEAAEGLEHVTAMSQHSLNVYDMLNHPTLVMSTDAARDLEERLSTWRSPFAKPLSSFLEANDQPEQQQQQQQS